MLSGEAAMSEHLTRWRKLAGAMWGEPASPQFFGDLELDAAPLLDFQDQVRRTTGVHLTLTHLVGKAVAHGLHEVPELSVRIAHGKQYPRESVDVFFIVTAEGGKELTGIKVVDADEKPVVDIATELTARLSAIDAGEDPELGRTKTMLATIPPRLLGLGMRLSAWLTSDLNLDLPRLGLPRQAFGGAMVTSVGMWGVKHAYSPLSPMYRLPVLVLVGAAEQRPVVVDGQVVARPMLTLTATFDHRYVDGLQAARFGDAIRAYCADPAAYEPALPSKAPSAVTAS
jgi:pyruvate dehydrogenase E2 component (dihydrolipoamide acetyltransferase)